MFCEGGTKKPRKGGGNCLSSVPVPRRRTPFALGAFSLLTENPTTKEAQCDV